MITLLDLLCLKAGRKPQETAAPVRRASHAALSVAQRRRSSGLPQGSASGAGGAALRAAPPALPTGLHAE
eukprot:9585582-Alexandrium_andersonii.AAC.1